jgi:hypothetical protein
MQDVKAVGTAHFIEIVPNLAEKKRGFCGSEITEKKKVADRRRQAASTDRN